MKPLHAVILILCAGLCRSAPTHEPLEWETDPEFTGDHFEGDLILDDTRNGVNTPVRYWPGGIIYYSIDSIFDDEHRAAIRTAMDTIEAPTCVRFEEVTSSEQLHYVNITGDNTGCNANVGYLRRVQKMNLQLFPLNTGCFIMGKIVHELLHAVGFFHMQSNPNRDDYVLILTENIRVGYENAFQKMLLNDFGVEYDYASMMHYPPASFSSNGLPTIVALQDLPPGTMGQRVAMTPSDILKINRMYRCFEVTTTTEAVTESTTENSTESTTENSTESTTENSTESTTENSTQSTKESTPNDTTENSTDATV